MAKLRETLVNLIIAAKNLSSFSLIINLFFFKLFNENTMNLITFTFEMDVDGQSGLIKAIEELKNFWKDQGFTISLFRDTSQPNRFMQIFLTEKTVDELTDMIHNQPQAKAVFETIRNSEARVVVSCLEQIL